MAFLGVCAILTYIKYYSGDHDTAVYHLGYVASGFSIAVYGSPLISVVRMKIRHMIKRLKQSLPLLNKTTTGTHFVRRGDCRLIIRDSEPMRANLKKNYRREREKISSLKITDLVKQTSQKSEKHAQFRLYTPY